MRASSVAALCAVLAMLMLATASATTAHGRTGIMQRHANEHGDVGGGVTDTVNTEADKEDHNKELDASTVEGNSGDAGDKTDTAKPETEAADTEPEKATDKPEENAAEGDNGNNQPETEAADKEPEKATDKPEEPKPEEPKPEEPKPEETAAEGDDGNKKPEEEPHNPNAVVAPPSTEEAGKDNENEKPHAAEDGGNEKPNTIGGNSGSKPLHTGGNEDPPTPVKTDGGDGLDKLAEQVTKLAETMKKGIQHDKAHGCHHGCNHCCHKCNKCHEKKDPCDHPKTDTSPNPVVPGPDPATKSPEPVIPKFDCKAVTCEGQWVNKAGKDTLSFEHTAMVTDCCDEKEYTCATVTCSPPYVDRTDKADIPPQKGAALGVENCCVRQYTCESIVCEGEWSDKKDKLEIKSETPIAQEHCCDIVPHPCETFECPKCAPPKPNKDWVELSEGQQPTVETCCDKKEYTCATVTCSGEWVDRVEKMDIKSECDDLNEDKCCMHGCANFECQAPFWEDKDDKAKIMREEPVDEKFCCKKPPIEEYTCEKITCDEPSRDRKDKKEIKSEKALSEEECCEKPEVLTCATVKCDLLQDWQDKPDKADLSVTKWASDPTDSTPKVDEKFCCNKLIHCGTVKCPAPSLMDKEEKKKLYTSQTEEAEQQRDCCSPAVQCDVTCPADRGMLDKVNRDQILHKADLAEEDRIAACCDQGKACKDVECLAATGHKKKENWDQLIARGDKPEEHVATCCDSVGEGKLCEKVKCNAPTWLRDPSKSTIKTFETEPEKQQAECCQAGSSCKDYTDKCEATKGLVLVDKYEEITFTASEDPVAKCCKQGKSCTSVSCPEDKGFAKVEGYDTKATVGATLPEQRKDCCKTLEAKKCTEVKCQTPKVLRQGADKLQTFAQDPGQQANECCEDGKDCMAVTCDINQGFMDKEGKDKIAAFAASLAEDKQISTCCDAVTKCTDVVCPQPDWTDMLNKDKRGRHRYHYSVQGTALLQVYGHVRLNESKQNKIETNASKSNRIIHGRCGSPKISKWRCTIHT